MGGIGSGRRYQSGKKTSSDMHRLDIRRLQRNGLLSAGRVFGWQWSSHGDVVASINIRTEHNRIILDYRTRSGSGEWQPMHYPIFLSSTYMHFGGERRWFICPASGCGRRVAILYGGSVFACRHCHNLAYDSQRESLDDRAARQADKIRARLDWELGILNGDGWKPKGMHWRTYARLKARHDAFAQISFAAISVKLKRIDESLDDWL